MGKYLIYWTNYDRFTVQLISQIKLNCVTNIQNKKMITKTNQKFKDKTRASVKDRGPNFSVSKLINCPHELQCQIIFTSQSKFLIFLFHSSGFLFRPLIVFLCRL